MTFSNVFYAKVAGLCFVVTPGELWLSSVLLHLTHAHMRDAC